MKFDLTRFEVKKSAILDATHKCIYEQGIANISMRSIAQEARVSQSVLHYYFKSKEDLLNEYTKTLLDRMIYEIERRYKHSDSPEKKIEAVFEAGRAFCSKQPELFVTFVDSWELSIRNPRMQKFFAHLYDSLTRLIEEIIEEGRAAGVFNAVNKENLSVFIIAFIRGTGLQWYMREESFDLEMLFEEFFGTVKALLYKKPGRLRA